VQELSFFDKPAALLRGGESQRDNGLERVQDGIGV
jgi:hypothetical protein